MKRNKLLLFGLVSTLIIGLSKNIVNADTVTNTPYNINFQMGDNSSEMYFNWFSPYNNGSKLQIAKASNVQNGKFPSNSTISGTVWSSTYSFTTGNPNSGFNFAVFGDPQIGAFDSNKHSSLPHSSLADDQNAWANTLKEVTSNPVDFLFLLGDQVNDYGTLSKKQDQYKSFFQCRCK